MVTLPAQEQQEAIEKLKEIMDALGDAADAHPEKTVEILGGLRAKFDSLSPEEPDGHLAEPDDAERRASFGR